MKELADILTGLLINFVMVFGELQDLLGQFDHEIHRVKMMVRIGKQHPRIYRSLGLI